jgi:formylglycine-generating enzyme required for sulfatase activity
MLNRFIALLFIVSIAVSVFGVAKYTEESATSAKTTKCEFEPEMVLIKEGAFVMGAGSIYPEESPTHKVHVEDFFISKYEVTNGEFEQFVEDTNYITVAERYLSPENNPGLQPELLRPGSAVFVKLDEAVKAKTFLNWWHFIEGANWRHPNGPNSDIEGKENYPVVHIALEDAQAYADWKGHRLPTEAEYEFASRGGLDGKMYATGNTPKNNGQYTANTWQGVFPFINTLDDGFEGLAPVGCFEPNGYGLHDMIGNVWEWTRSPFYPTHNFDTDKVRHYRSVGFGFDPNKPQTDVGVIKGGSFLCSEDFCMRSRPAARQAQDTGLGTSHIGFRTVLDAK